MDKIIYTPKYKDIAYTVQGEGQNCIVLLHGFPLDRSIWTGIAMFFSNNYKLIIPDLPGSGKSSFVKEDLTMEDMAEFVYEILVHESVQRAIVVGHSMGGYVALAFADMYPEAVVGIAMVHSTAFADNDEKKEQRRKSIQLFKKGGKEPFIKQMIPVLFSESYKKSNKDTVKTIESSALLTNSNSLTAFYNAMIERQDKSDRLQSIQRMLWVVGEDDAIIKKEVIMQQTSSSNVNFVYVYNNCGHMSMYEQPNLLKEHLLSFADYCYEIE